MLARRLPTIIPDMSLEESLETTQIYLGLAKKVQRRMVQELALLAHRVEELEEALAE